jgi:arylsulfatase A-like enzyme
VLAAAAPPHASKPNILVIVLDDIGIDQAGFAPFDWNADPLVPNMPVLASIAANGVSFTNFWATPECSPSRAAMLTGRYGFRTGVITAIVDPMLPVNQLHPAEITLPKLLRRAHYKTAMLGKYHLGGGPENTPRGFGYQAPATTTGLDFYDGYWDLPPSIDKSIGGQISADDSPYTCGGMGGLGVVGAACFPDGTCIDNIEPFEAMALGATPLLDASGALSATCADGVCGNINFDMENAYYAWQRVTTRANGHFTVSPTPEREYLTSFIQRRSVEWINQQHHNRPWLAFVTHSASHTPIQPPPPTLSTPGLMEPECNISNLIGDYRIQFKRMCEAVDRSVGEMLIELGLATEKNGEFALKDPRQTNTMIIVFGDNGSLGQTVLPPFAPAYAKQSVYQTGVWTPCVIAGPMVASPGRAVADMVNVVDLFSLIADAAGVDWREEIPDYRPIDARPMLPYLTDPGASRSW